MLRIKFCGFSLNVCNVIGHFQVSFFMCNAIKITKQIKCRRSAIYSQVYASSCNVGTLGIGETFFIIPKSNAVLLFAGRQTAQLTLPQTKIKTILHSLELEGCFDIVLRRTFFITQSIKFKFPFYLLMKCFAPERS